MKPVKEKMFHDPHCGFYWAQMYLGGLPTQGAISLWARDMIYDRMIHDQTKEEPIRWQSDQ